MSIPKEHVHITFLTPWIVIVGFLGFQSITLRCKTPCTCKPVGRGVAAAITTFGANFGKLDKGTVNLAKWLDGFVLI